MPIPPIAADDLAHILTHTLPLWEGVHGRHLFITGGTGFFGCWLLESFVYANRMLDLRASLTVLTRDPRAFASKCPHLAAEPALALWPGDVRDFAFPPQPAQLIIHAATAADAALHAAAPELLLDTILQCTRRVLDYATASHSEALLLTSSGAVYGPQPPDLTHIPEDCRLGPDPLDPGAAYAEGKRMAEQMCVVWGRQAGFAVKVARCFAFLGPHLPLDRHFAAGNFIHDALHGGPIRVQGDGTPYRSYLYAADLAIWLWTVLLAGVPGRAYNVGSEEAVTVAELARAVAAAVTPRPEVIIAGVPVPGVPATRYLPSTQRAREELGLRTLVALPDAITRTVRWFTSAQDEIGACG